MNSNKSRRIVIIGGDVGGGKSTHSRLLVEWLRNSGVNAAYAHVKSSHLLAGIFLEIIIRIIGLSKYRRAVREKNMSPARLLIETRPSLFERIFPLFTLLTLVDLIVQLIIRYYIKSLRHRVIVYEDHVVGYLNDMIYFLVFYKNKLSRFIWRLGFSLLYNISRKSKIYFLKAPYQELEERYRRRGTMAELIEYLAAGRVAAKLLREYGLDLTIINTGGVAVSEVQERIRSGLEQLLVEAKGD